MPLEGLKDPGVLLAAAQEGRVLVSNDVSTMPGHLRSFLLERASPGLILVPQELAIAKAIEVILLICEACDSRDLDNRICLVPSLAMYGF